MPIYEFRCTQCDVKFEELCRSISDADSVFCPRCKDPGTERLMSLFAMTSKGSTAGGQLATSRSGCATCSATNCQTCSGG